MSQIIFCNNCRSANQISSKFCSYCGHQMVQTRPVAVKYQETVCPRCNQYDQVKNVGTILMSESQIVGYGEYRDVKLTKLAEFILTALGSKPRPNFIEKTFFAANVAKQIKEYERVAARWDISYYCSRCGVVFFTLNGVKHYSGISDFKNLLRRV
jgi:hypothetical protein